MRKLNKHQKINLIKIIKVLKNYKKNLISKKINYNFNQIKRELLLLGAKKVDYVEPIDLKTLKRPKKNKYNLFFAFYIGKVRFIDNF